MKRIFTIFLIFAVSLPLLAQRESSDSRSKEGWREKILAEKMAFFNSEIGLTSEEAKAFWPVYNKTEREQHEAMKAVHFAFKALQDAVSEGKDDAHVSALLDAYLKAGEAARKNDKVCVKEYSRILPPSKVAKVFIAEEKFRRAQINRLRGCDAGTFRGQDQNRNHPKDGSAAGAGQ